MTHAIDVRIRNDVSDIAIVRAALDDLAREFAIPVRALTELQVALDEVISNVVKYAWDDGGRHEFLVRIRVQPGRVDLEVFDDGKEFDPMVVLSPNHPLPNQRPPPGGLGIHIIKELVDHFTYERIGGCNHTTLSKTCEVGTSIQRGQK